MQKRPVQRQSGAITSYVHPDGMVGVLVEVACNSEFVARSDEFQQLMHDLALHIAAADPKFIHRQDETQAKRATWSNSPPDEMVCLYDQPFIKDTSITISQLILASAAKLHEDIVVIHFARFSLGHPPTIASNSGHGQQIE